MASLFIVYASFPQALSNYLSGTSIFAPPSYTPLFHRQKIGWMNKTLIEGTVCTKQGSVEYARFIAADREDRDELATALRKLRKLLPTMSVYEVETAIDFLHRGLLPVAERASRDAQPIRIADSL